MNMRLIIVILVAFSMLSTGCIRRPKGVLSDSKMAPLVADLEIGDAYLRNNPFDAKKAEAREALFEYVLEKHRVSKEDYDSTMAWYGRNPDQYYEFYTKVDKQLALRRSKITGSNASQLDTRDLWPYSHMALVSPLSPSEGLEFSFPVADIEKGERLRLRMRMNSQEEGNVMFGVEYENGVTGYSYASVKSKRVDISLQTDTAQVPVRVFGNLLFNGPVRKPIWIDSISIGRLPFDSLEYYRINGQRHSAPPAPHVLKKDPAPIKQDSLPIKSSHRVASRDLMNPETDS